LTAYAALPPQLTGAVRPLGHSRNKGFKELCAQLARAETPAGARFERKGTPDAGVECYSVLSDGSEWGWQAKYFDTLGDSQWSQLDKSVKATIEKHPRLVRCFVCTPLDRPDARTDGKKSTKDKWDEHAGRVRFWFNVRGGDAAWFNARLDEALLTAGPRYTPEVHVDRPIALEFEAFGRTGSPFERLKGHARAI